MERDSTTLVAALLPDLAVRWKPAAMDGDGDARTQVETTVTVVSISFSEAEAEAVLRLRWTYTILDPTAPPVTHSEEKDITVGLDPGKPGPAGDRPA